MLKLQKETLAWNSNASIPIRLATILLGAALISQHPPATHLTLPLSADSDRTFHRIP